MTKNSTTPTPKYTYFDWNRAHNKITRFTRGRFLGWTQPMGPLSVPYARFARRNETLYVPVYMLTAETRAVLPQPAKKEPS